MTVRIVLLVAAALFAALSPVACASTAQPSDSTETTITVFAAASLADSFQTLAAAYEDERPGVKIALNFAGSQTLRTQLEHGAKADVFASANWEHMAQAKAGGLLGSAPEYFAANRLAVAVPANSDAVRTLSDLARPGVSVAVAAEEVPAGAYTRESLALLASDNAYPDDFASAALSNVVTNETSVRGVAQKVALGEVDAGIVYETDAKAAQYADAVHVIEIPLQFNPAAQYPIAALSTADELETALEFIGFVQGDAGQAVLREHGFAPAAADVACPCHASEADGG